MIVLFQLIHFFLNILENKFLHFLLLTFSSATENYQNKLFPYLTELCNDDFSSIPTLFVLELKWLRSFEKAELGL